MLRLLDLALRMEHALEPPQQIEPQALLAAFPLGQCRWHQGAEFRILDWARSAAAKMATPA
jgi:hypothetical protein